MSLSWCHFWLHPQYYCMPLFLVFHIPAMSTCLHSPECYAFLYPCVYLFMLFPFCHSCTSKLLFFHGSSVTSGTFSMWVVLPHVLCAYSSPHVWLAMKYSVCSHMVRPLHRNHMWFVLISPVPKPLPIWRKQSAYICSMNEINDLWNIYIYFF